LALKVIDTKELHIRTTKNSDVNLKILNIHCLAHLQIKLQTKSYHWNALFCPRSIFPSPHPWCSR